MDVIKDVFTHCISVSSFPSISWIDFCNFCTSWNIPDNKTCTMQTIDRIFIATNVELVELEDNPDRDLCRYEFFEILVRMAGAKFKDSKAAQTWDEATEMIIQENLIPYTKHIQRGQEFRTEDLWTLPVDDLFRANLDNLRKVYNEFVTGTKRHMDIDDCRTLL